MPKEIRTKSSNEPVKPDVKNQAAGKPPIIKYIDRIQELYGKSETDEYGNVESATDRIRDPEFFQNKLKNLQKEPAKKAPRMSAVRSWQVIKQSMDKDELAEHYKNHPEDKPVELLPVKPDPMITEMLGEDEDWLL